MPIAVGRCWDTYTVGTRIEAFMLAGGSMRGENLSLKNRVLFLKAASRNSLSKKLSKSHIYLTILFLTIHGSHRFKQPISHHELRKHA